MAHPRAVICNMCGGKYFRASLPIHQKTCAQKQLLVEIPCPYCDKEMRQSELAGHLKRCPRKPPSQSPNKGGTGKITLHKSTSVVEDVPAQQLAAATADGRIPCAVCGRKFAKDRIAKHQTICRKTGNRSRFDSGQQRQYTSAGDVVKGSAATSFGGVRSIRRTISPSKKKPVSNWRRQHEEFQQIAKQAPVMKPPSPLSRHPHKRPPHHMAGETGYAPKPAPRSSMAPKPPTTNAPGRLPKLSNLSIGQATGRTHGRGPLTESHCVLGSDSLRASIVRSFGGNHGGAPKRRGVTTSHVGVRPMVSFGGGGGGGGGGGFIATNATSLGNPLASNAYMTAPHPTSFRR